MFDINVKMLYFFVKEAIPLLTASKEVGSIVVMTSCVAYTQENLLGLYSPAKLAVVGVVKCLAKELYRFKINVNAVAPGIVKTRFSRKVWKGREKLACKRFKVYRLAEVEDVSGVIAFLASHQAEYINGETIMITGVCSTKL